MQTLKDLRKAVDNLPDSDEAREVSGFLSRLEEEIDDVDAAITQIYQAL